MAIPLMVICEWQGNRLVETEVENPLWTDVEAAIRQLNNDNFNDLYLRPEVENEEHLLGICGGAGRYLVSGDTGDGEFPTVIDQSKPSEPKGLLMVGGQLGDYPNNWIIDLTMALAAAKSFYIHGGFDDSDTWSRV